LSFTQEQQGRHEPNAFSWLDGTLDQPELVGGEGDDIIFALADPPDQRAAVRPEFHRLKYVRIAQPLENAALRKYWRQIDHILELWPVIVIEAQEQPSIPVSKKIQFLYLCRSDCRFRISMSAAAMCSGRCEACSISQSHGLPSPG